MLIKGGDIYSGTGYWWDEDDNEYIFTTTWEYHYNWPDQPDEWVLIDVELEDSQVLLTTEQAAEVHAMCRKGGWIWNDMEQDGFPADAQEVSWI